jgi:hypothetical protein
MPHPIHWIGWGRSLVLGLSSSNNLGLNKFGSADILLVKYDKDGKLLWSKTYGGSKWEHGKKVIELSDGSIAILANSYSRDGGFINNAGETDTYDGILIKCDKDGNKEWITSFGGSDTDYFENVVEVPNGSGFYVCGGSASTDAGFENKGGYDAFLIKYDKDGKQLLFKTFNGSENDYFYDMEMLSDESLIVVGYSNSTHMSLENKGGRDGII